MPNDIRKLSRDWFETVWNHRDDAAIERLASTEVECHGLSEDGRPTRGFEPFKRFRAGILSAFPDLRLHVQDVLVEADKSAVRFTFSGTHTGDGVGVPPTGRAVIATAIVILQFADGRIVKAWNEFDSAGMMRQLQTPDAILRA